MPRPERSLQAHHTPGHQYLLQGAGSVRRRIATDRAGYCTPRPVCHLAEFLMCSESTRQGRTAAREEAKETSQPSTLIPGPAALKGSPAGECCQCPQGALCPAWPGQLQLTGLAQCCLHLLTGLPETGWQEQPPASAAARKLCCLCHMLTQRWTALTWHDCQFLIPGHREREWNGGDGSSQMAKQMQLIAMRGEEMG